MKKGFTLQEVLLTLAIVGIAAAIVIPGMRANMPSRDRMEFLKAYSELSRIIEDVSDDSADVYDLDDPSCNTQQILSCPLKEGRPGTSAENLAQLVQARMSLRRGGGTNFITTDGIEWDFAAGGNNILVTIITNGDEHFPVNVAFDGQISTSNAVQEILNGRAPANTKGFKKFLEDNQNDLESWTGSKGDGSNETWFK